MMSEMGLAWCDSCASQNHPMIDKLWNERIVVGDMAIGLRGPVRGAYFSAMSMGSQIYQRYLKR